MEKLPAWGCRYRRYPRYQKVAPVAPGTGYEDDPEPGSFKPDSDFDEVTLQ